MLFHGFGGSHTGKDCVAPDVVFCLLYGDQLCQIIDGRLACTVGDLRNIRHKATNRGNVDDAATVLSHVFYCSLAGHKHASEIECDSVQKDLRIGICKIQILSGIGCSEIVDQNIDSTGIPDDIFHHSGEGFRFGSVVEHAFCTGTLHPQLNKPFIRNSDLIGALVGYYQGIDMRPNTLRKEEPTIKIGVDKTIEDIFPDTSKVQVRQRIIKKG